MKRTITTLALAAILTGTSHAAISGKKPAFMDKQQLAAMRASASSAASIEAGNPAFFTGKPYLAASDGYAFKYRSYCPGIARWTSEDPSGFPDGANGSYYAPNPVSELDPNGLRATLAFENQIHTISLSIYVYDRLNKVTAATVLGWKAAIERDWAYSGTDKSNGESLELKTNVAIGLHGAAPYNRAASLAQYDNVVEMTNHSNVVSNVSGGGRVGTFVDNLRDGVVVHEVGHFMDAADMYTVNPDGSKSPNQGWFNTIMGGSNPLGINATKLDANLVLRALGENTHLFE